MNRLDLAAPAAEPIDPYDADPKIGPLMRDLLACTCAQLEAIGRAACACCVVWGDDRPPADFCDCTCDGGHGQAWVRLVRLDPRQTGSTIPRSITGRAGGCHTPVRWRAVVEAGVYRCIAVPGDDGSPPGCEERERDAYALVADLRALRGAFACCDALRPYAPLTPLSAGPTPNQGGCGGAVVQFALDL
ncbi:hypothetical protein DY218_27260 [Streptomyces triticagri]|uniref:Uncharacterized protein n=1 Tax=Streptomyces triticagri TaxID=2293568 RepID=A0A372LYH4_9ACTN|nr:hypothetical protein [Streptomyces triticagri]RFU83609.1 hypothetical protein DY218_27260 [Streptomyces triticagri]